MKKISINVYLFVCVLLSVTGCSTEDPFTNYVGYWEAAEGSRNYSIIKIYKSDDSFYMDINVLSKKAPDGGVKVPAKLIIKDKNLYIDSPFMEGIIAYYSDKESLVIGNENSYLRLTDDQFSKAKEQWIQCREISKKFIKDSKATPLSYDRNKKISKLKEKYNENMKKEGCKI